MTILLKLRFGFYSCFEHWRIGNQNEAIDKGGVL